MGSNTIATLSGGDEINILMKVHEQTDRQTDTPLSAKKKKNISLPFLLVKFSCYAHIHKQMQRTENKAINYLDTPKAVDANRSCRTPYGISIGCCVHRV